MSNFIEIAPEEFNQSVFKLIGKDWMLITAQTGDKINTMTASWGGFGVMWGKNVAYVVIRPQRYTKEFVDSSDTFSLSFLDNSFRKQLNYLGSVSGKDENKIEKSNLSVSHDQSAPYFGDAKIAVFCKKLYAQEYNPECFVDPKLAGNWYPNADYHTLYIAEVTKILINA